MIAYYLGILVGLIGVSAALSILSGNSLAGGLVVLILLAMFGGVDGALLFGDGLKRWRDSIEKAKPSFILLFLTGMGVFTIPFAAAYVVWKQFSSFIAAWLILIFGAVACSWALLYLLAKVCDRRLQLNDDVIGEE